MTEPKANPKARATRLYARARDAHEKVSALVDDLRDEEGKYEAWAAQGSLSELCMILERLAE